MKKNMDNIYAREVSVRLFERNDQDATNFARKEYRNIRTHTHLPLTSATGLFLAIFCARINFFFFKLCINGEKAMKKRCIIQYVSKEIFSISLSHSMARWVPFFMLMYPDFLYVQYQIIRYTMQYANCVYRVPVFFFLFLFFSDMYRVQMEGITAKEET